MPLGKSNNSSRSCRPPAARDVLDLGCGPGRFAVPMAQRGCVIDLKGKECVARALQPTTAEVMDDGTIMVKRSWVVDDWTRVCNELIIVRGEQPRRTFRFDANLYSGQELRDCLKSVGFGEVSLFGDLLSGEFGFHAERLVALGEK